MYDVNPLGPMMHLKELERRAALAAARRERGEGWSTIWAQLKERLAIAVRGVLSGTARHKEV